MICNDTISRAALSWHRDESFVEFDCRRTLSNVAGRSISPADLSRIFGRMRCVAPAMAPDDLRAWFDRLARGRSDRFGSQNAGSEPGEAQAYESAIAPFVLVLEEELSSRFRHLFWNASGSRVPAGLLSWYRDRLLSVARYTLHVAFVASGENYSEWISVFVRAPAVAWSEVFREYPVLMTLLCSADVSARAAITEALARIDADQDLLSERFGVVLPLHSVEAGLSDCHRGGRTVMRLHFSPGSIIYKPKPLDIDHEIAAFAARTPHKWGLHELAILPRDGYGWMEDAAPLSRGIARPDAIGRVAALFWLLNATDMHSENIIGQPDGFRALDLETVLAAPILEVPGAPDPSWRAHSLLTTQLLQISHGETRRPNISGLFPDPDLGLLNASIRFEIVGDKVEIRRTPPDRRTDEKNASWTISEQSDIAELTAAFAHVATRECGSIARFISELPNHLQSRLVLRDTVFYEGVLARMHQPRFLRDGMDLSLELLALFGGQLATSPISARPDLMDLSEHFIASEIAQLLAGDVPYFSAEIGSLKAITSGGQQRRTFSRSGKDWAQEKVAGITSSDIAEQTALLRLALGSLPIPPSIAHSGFTLPAILAGAAEELAQEAFQSEGQPARWIGMVGDARHDELHISAGQRNLFSGSWGVLIGIEAATAAAGTGPIPFLDREARAWSRALQAQDGYRGVFHTAGLGFEGLGGLAFAVALLARIAPHRWQFLVPAFVRFLSSQKTQIIAAIAADRQFDVIAGSAGLLLGIDNVAKAHLATPKAVSLSGLEMVRAEAAHHLVSALQDVGGAWTWITSSAEAPNLGFAHGWAGIVAALAATHRQAPDSKIECALSAVASFPWARYKRDSAWFDYRHDSPTPLNRSWCNGAAGLLRGLHATEGATDFLPGAVTELRNRLRADLGHSDARRFCCGEMGTLDLLIDIEGRDTDTFAQLSVAARQILLDALQSRDAPETRFPSLFQGRAGIIYTAARCFDPRVPSLSGQ